MTDGALSAERKIVHMDVDTGVDDALAIMMSLNLAGVRLIGVSTVAGNTSAGQAAVNTAYLLDRLGADIPIYVGREETCDGKAVNPAHSVHGEDGLGGITGDYQVESGRLKAGSVEAIVGAAREYGEALRLVMTGPVTNLAMALSMDREALSRVGEIVVMGGSIGEGGNVTPFAEFNAYSDPKAMEMVVSSGLAVTMIPLDVTHELKLLTRDLTGGRCADAEMCAFIDAMTATYRRFHQATNGFDGCYLHDPLTVAAVVRRDLFTFERMRVAVVTSGEEAGRTDGYAAGDSGAGVEVAMGVNAEGCLELFWGAVGRARVG